MTVTNPTALSYKDDVRGSHLSDVLKKYIIYRCTLSEYCCEEDFDEAALDALLRMPLLQALQTVEHYASSVSERIIKKSAYLMGILHGQQDHWQKVLQNTSSHKGRRNVTLPEQLLSYIGQCCLHGNCLPSDFTPEVCLRLRSLSIHLSIKAVSAFNSNKRIVAGPNGGIINRSRFFLRLIQNVAEQARSTSTGVVEPESPTASRTNSHYSDQFEACTDMLGNLGLNGGDSTSRDQELRIKELETDIVIRDQREKMLLLEMKELKTKLLQLQEECKQLKQGKDTEFDILNFSYFD